MTGTRKLYVRFSFAEGGHFDLKLDSQADAESVYRRTLREWEAGNDVAIRRLDDEHHRGGWVNSDIAGIALLDEAEILGDRVVGRRLPTDPGRGKVAGGARVPSGCSMRWMVTVGSALALLTVTSAAPASTQVTPAAYRVSLNRVCRSYTVKLHPLEAEMVRAEKRKTYGRTASISVALIVLTLAQDAQIEKAPVPRAMSKQMARIVRLLRSIDVHARLALDDAAANEPTGMLKELETAGRLATPLNGLLDRAGLRDCGSNQ